MFFCTGVLKRMMRDVQIAEFFIGSACGYKPAVFPGSGQLDTGFDTSTIGDK